MDGIKRTAQSASRKTSSAATHRTVQKSKTLNRKFVKRPVASKAGIVSESKARGQNSISRVNVRTAAQSRQGATMVTRTQRVSLSPISQKQNVAQAKKVAKTQASQQAAPAVQVKQNASASAQAAARIVAQRKAPSVQSQVRMHESPVAIAARNRAMIRKQHGKQVHMSSQELKERAISEALNKISAMDKTEAKRQRVEAKAEKQRSRFVVALSFAAVSVALLGYLVYLNLPDLSVRVAAMNSGIENAYPSYVPMNYRLQGLAKEDNGTITMSFTRNDGGKFTMIEKKSSWDSSALLNNYVKDNWGDNYTVAKGQGLTIYISGSNAVWVNGGVMYRIEAEENMLSTDDLHDIAISL